MQILMTIYVINAIQVVKLVRALSIIHAQNATSIIYWSLNNAITSIINFFNITIQ